MMLNKTTKGILWVSLPKSADPEYVERVSEFLKNEFEVNLDCHVLVTIQPTTIKTFGIYSMRIPYWFVRLLMWIKPKKK